jgi:hypothetical protein
VVVLPLAFRSGFVVVAYTLFIFAFSITITLSLVFTSAPLSHPAPLPWGRPVVCRIKIVTLGDVSDKVSTTIDGETMISRRPLTIYELLGSVILACSLGTVDHPGTILGGAFSALL